MKSPIISPATFPQPEPTRFHPVLACTVLALALTATRLTAGGDGAAPATVNKEADLTTIVLKPEAEQSLRLKVVTAERRIIPATRLFPGEVMISLATKENRPAPLLGGTLDEVLKMADMQAAADGRVVQAQVQTDVARLACARARKMFESDATSVRIVDEANAALALAESALATATSQREILGVPVGQAAQRFWVRVPVYSGEIRRLDAKAGANIRTLAATSPALAAKPVSGPATASPQTSTVDWYYELSADAGMRAGERVAVEIPTLDSKVESLVLPFNSVLHDIHGGQWVYEQVAEHTYTRRRVQVARVAEGDAVLSSGPPVGSKIVTDGSAELFGTEFMTGK